MFTKGECTIGEKAYGVYVSHTKSRIEVLLIENNSVVSAYKMDSTGSYSFNTSKARDVAKWIQAGVKGCTRKNGQALPWDLGTLTEHNFTKSKVEYIVQIYRNELVGAYIGGDNIRIQVEYIQHLPFPQEIKYVKLTEIKKDLEYAEDELDAVQVRTVEEIALEKEDVSWLKNKKYYIVNDDETAEKLFTFLDNYNGMISYDTETTGLKINCFGKVGSKYEADLRKYNEEHPDEKIRADKLVGIIFCVEPDVSYYFPCGNRKFKNLYEDKNSPVRKKIIERTRAYYTVGAGVNANMLGDMRKYITSTPDDELRLDVILMERVRNILENKHIVAHHGSFEWKVGWQYEIDTNLKDDSMLMHQIMYKFRSTTRNSGEPSNLKYLAKRELGIDQWDLKDFFPNLKEDKKGTVRERANSKNKGNRIDFSYMDYEGTRVYAPTDGDVTLQLCLKYKSDMMENHKELEFLYNVEMAVSAAVGYMEFYGHRLDESKILGAREDTRANIVMIEHDIRKEIGFNSVNEDIAYDELVALKDIIKAEKDQTKIDKELLPKLTEACMKLKAVIDADEEHMLNLSAPGQVADLFYNKLGYPMQGDKPSVAKKEIKGLLKEKDEEGNPKYKVAALYSKYKNEETLMTKFFDNLPYFMYPGGFIFSSYGQIATATGRMSCNKPNAQQYPKVITKIVVPREDYIMVDADYSQIEYRVLTALAKNEGLAELFSDPDSDYHTLMASMMYDVPYASVTPSMRSAAKSFNFGIPYGMGFGSLAILLTGKNTPQTRDEAREKYDLYFKNQPRTKRFFEDVKEMARVNKYTKTLFNRYRYYSFEDKDGKVNEGRKAAALRQAGNAVIQGSAADIFKISVARNFNYIRKNKLLGLLLIINMVHDEQLMEINTKYINVERALADIGCNMQYDIPGFPPLFIGAGVGPAWGYAKGKMAEIHPVLLQNIMDNAINIPLLKEKPEANVAEMQKYMADKVVQFRRDKVAAYLADSSNWHKDIHPAIGGLINLQFNYGRGDDAKSYVGPNGETYSDTEFLMLNIADFLAENNIDAKPEYFQAQELVVDTEEDEGYDDEEEEIDEFETSSYDDIGVFSKVDESDKIFGSSLNDLISIFGCCVLESQKVCGFDVRGMHYRNKDALIDYIADHQCDDDDPEGLEVVMLNDGNVLKHTGVYVKGLKASETEAEYKRFKHTTKFESVIDYKSGDIHNRSQA